MLCSRDHELAAGQDQAAGMLCSSNLSVRSILVLAQVRASSLQELVYKQGQAGITKATVSIVFNNEDKQSSPVGFDHDDKITVTRQVLLQFTSNTTT